MSTIFKIGIFCFIFSIVLINNTVNTFSKKRPIIGILSQETTRFSDNEKSYIAASYVKFVEGAGARVVPIRINQSRSYYRDLMTKISGVLLPGGATSIKHGGYANAGEIIYQIAEDMNRNGTYFPILGICLGFELLAFLASGKEMKRVSCNSESQALPLQFERNFKQSRLFTNASEEIIDILEKDEVTINFHIFCITKEKFKTHRLNRNWRIISQNNDENGIRFISSMEHINFPFYGLQFHPEKNIYEWIIGRNIPHSSNAIKVSQYFANFFVDEARKNKNKFSDRDEEMTKLIYNYPPPLYTGNTNSYRSVFQQIYLWSENDLPMLNFN
ncbi:PREDICTED: gamma-glutamyl hydrolase-like [Polistes dominula]|uniref:folate gamma-glutamyl hydrolase n=1 Tax=Polistes dominula TaxID=743375 RepID=A0ABM1HYE0_POLDO|nr:PREDICTED: gamma-glutamyl hydrolase-like [Polistes dominula]